MITIPRAEKSLASYLACWHQPAGSRRLVSLWDMIQVHAWEFFQLTTSLEELEREFVNLLSDHTINDVAVIVHMVVGAAEDSCKKLNLDSALDQIERIKQLGKTGGTAADAKAAIGDLCRRVEDQLKSRMFWYIPPDRVKYFQTDLPAFGSKVFSDFPEMIADIEDASRCLGAALWTAAVYHLMRVMEFALVKLTAKLGITIPDIEHKTWGQILAPIDAAVSALPNKSKEQESFSEAAIHLRQVKNAWRDPTMHNRRRYDQAESESVFQNVKSFVVNLTTI